MSQIDCADIVSELFTSSARSAGHRSTRSGQAGSSRARRSFLGSIILAAHRVLLLKVRFLISSYSIFFSMISL